VFQTQTNVEQLVYTINVWTYFRSEKAPIVTRVKIYKIKHTWEDNNKMDQRKIGGENVIWIDVPQNGVQ
jgi:hypothetical protein